MKDETTNTNTTTEQAPPVEAPAQTEAPAVIETKVSLEVPMQGAFPWEMPGDAGKVFEVVATKNGGARTKNRKAADMGSLFGINPKTQKDTLSLVAREARLQTWKQILSWAALQKDEWICERASGRKDKYGRRHITIGLMEDPRKVMGDDELCEQVYPSFQPPFDKMSHQQKLEKLWESRKRQTLALKAEDEATVNVETAPAKTEPLPEPPKPVTPEPELTDEQKLQKMIDEEQAAIDAEKAKEPVDVS